MLHDDSKHEHYVKIDENCLAWGTADIATKCFSRQTTAPRLIHNAEATRKQLANPPADWSPRQDVTVVKRFHVTSWEAPQQISDAFKIKALLLN